MRIEAKRIVEILLGSSRAPPGSVRTMYAACAGVTVIGAISASLQTQLPPRTALHRSFQLISSEISSALNWPPTSMPRTIRRGVGENLKLGVRDTHRSPEHRRQPLGHARR